MGVAFKDPLGLIILQNLGVMDDGPLGENGLDGIFRGNGLVQLAQGQSYTHAESGGFSENDFFHEVMSLGRLCGTGRDICSGFCSGFSHLFFQPGNGGGKIFPCAALGEVISQGT